LAMSPLRVENKLALKVPPLLGRVGWGELK